MAVVHKNVRGVYVGDLGQSPLTLRIETIAIITDGKCLAMSNDECRIIGAEYGYRDATFRNGWHRSRHGDNGGLRAGMRCS